MTATRWFLLSNFFCQLYFPLELTAQIAKAMEIPHPNFITGSQVLAEAAARKGTLKYQGI